MPNHTTSRLEITGDTNEIKRFVSMVDKGEDKHFDFGGVVCFPEELRNTSSPVILRSQEEIDTIWARWEANTDKKEFEKDRPFNLGITKETSDILNSKYGCDNWYSWNVTHWGTKWGAYDAGIWEVEDGFASITYTTAWNPATEFFINSSEQFPKLTFKHYFADEGGGFIGWEIVKNGKVVQAFSPEWNSEDGIELQKDLGVWYEEESE